MNDNTICPKCNGTMEEGWLPNSFASTITVSTWAKGQPHKLFLGLIRMPEAALPVVAYCCCECGYIEMYAKRA
jgi:hypothetical protein